MASIEHRPSSDGGMVYRVRVHTGSGKYVRRTFPTERLAQKFIGLVDGAGVTKALEIVDAVEGPGPEEVTLAAWLREHIEQLTGVTTGTRRDYLNYLTVDIEQGIGRLPVTAITRSVVAGWVNGMAERGRSGKSIRNRHSLLSAGMTAAVRAGLVAANPCIGIRMPDTSHLSTEATFLTPPEYLHLIHFIAPEWKPLVEVLAGTGMRFGEATALRVGDVDLSGSTPLVRVVRAWKHTDGQGAELGPPKSRAGRRTVSLPDRTARVVAELVAGRSGEEFLLLNRRGGVVAQNSFHSRAWSPALRLANGVAPLGTRRSGVREAATVPLGKTPRIHDLRHSHVSWLIAAGVPLPVIQRRLGHESISTTVNTYGHLAPDLHRQAADAVGRALEDVGDSALRWGHGDEARLLALPAGER